jgi:hypothetical protein
MRIKIALPGQASMPGQFFFSTLLHCPDRASFRIMTSNPTDSEWYSTPRDKRKRKGVELTLSAEARKRLDSLAKGTTMSAVVEALIMKAKARK